MEVSKDIMCEKAGSSEEKNSILTERFLMLMPSNLLLHTALGGHISSCAMEAVFAWAIYAKTQIQGFTVWADGWHWQNCILASSCDVTCSFIIRDLIYCPPKSISVWLKICSTDLLSWESDIISFLSYHVTPFLASTADYALFWWQLHPQSWGGCFNPLKKLWEHTETFSHQPSLTCNNLNS